MKAFHKQISVVFSAARLLLIVPASCSYFCGRVSAIPKLQAFLHFFLFFFSFLVFVFLLEIIKCNGLNVQFFLININVISLNDVTYAMIQAVNVTWQKKT